MLPVVKLSATYSYGAVQTYVVTTVANANCHDSVDQAKMVTPVVAEEPYAAWDAVQVAMDQCACSAIPVSSLVLR